MTTTIDFIVKEIHDVLLVPNTALKFRPDKGTFHGKKPLHDFKNKGGDSNQMSMRAGRKHMSPDSMDALMAAKGLGLVWTYDEQKNFKPIKVKIILAGDSTTAVASDKLQEGMTIVSGRVMKKNSTSKVPAGGSSSSRNAPRMFM
jgi:HlyD family secretion protein